MDEGLFIFLMIFNAPQVTPFVLRADCSILHLPFEIDSMELFTVEQNPKFPFDSRDVTLYWPDNYIKSLLNSEQYKCTIILNTS